MPHYYFDVADGGGLEPDPVGANCNSDVDAGNKAIRALAELARDHLYHGDLSKASVVVRDEEGAQVLVLTVTATLPNGG